MGYKGLYETALLVRGLTALCLATHKREAAGRLDTTKLIGRIPPRPLIDRITNNDEFLGDVLINCYI